MDGIFERNDIKPMPLATGSEGESKYVKRMILAARIISMIFTPFYLPVLSLLALFIFSYMSRLPLIYQLKVLILTYLFTVLLPTVLIHLYRCYQGWTSFQMGRKERRMVPYIIAIMCYFTCYYLMTVMRIPQFMANIVVTALAIQVVCALVNIWWKICIHMAGIGGMAGALLAISLVFQFNPLWWLSVIILVAGLVGTARMILRQHSLRQIVGGFMVGAVCGFLLIL
jgi:hypothetical protein